MQRDNRQLNSYDACHRLKQLVKNEVNMTQREAALAKRSSNFLNKLHEAENAVEQQNRTFNKLFAFIEPYRKNKDDCTGFLAFLEEDLQKEFEKNKALEKKLAQLEKDQASIVQCTHKLQETKHVLKEATNTYISNKSLPGRLQGVIVKRAGIGKDQFVPFNIADNETEELNQLWGKLHASSESNNSNYKKWRELLGLDVDNNYNNEFVKLDNQVVEEKKVNIPPAIELASSN